MSVPIKTPAIVKSIIKHTDTIVSYVLTPAKPLPMFRAGQFLHIAIDPYSYSSAWPESRVFSIESSPENLNEIKITIAIKGEFTGRLYNEVHEGDTVYLKLPYGSFYLEDGEKPCVLIAGGTGVTPFLSYLESCLLRKSAQDVRLYYGIRESRNFIFSDVLDRCKAELPNYKLFLYSQEPIEREHRSGILDIENIYNENGKDCVYYVSGPKGMVDAFIKYLEQAGVAADNIKIDNWG